MKPLIVLIGVFVVSLIVTKIIFPGNEIALSARIAMSGMLIFTAMGHFFYPKGMALMVPAFIPGKSAIVYGTGLLEIAAAIGLMIPAVRLYAGWLLILFFILTLPANINAALHHIDYRKGNGEGPGVRYLWFRIPLQGFFIGWVYLSVIRF
jgi:uncharacterized membrane protein